MGVGGGGLGRGMSSGSIVFQEGVSSIHWGGQTDNVTGDLSQI